MSRIVCRTPSTGKPIRASLANVGTNFTTIAEAPDFSVPDTSNRFPDRDSNDSSRAIRPGELFCLTPLSVYNKSAETYWIEVQVLEESGSSFIFTKVRVPPGDTAYIPLQGRSLFKRNPAGTNGDRLQIRAESSNKFDIWISLEEKLSNEHAGVED
jgi:hypothetical protein